MACWKGAIITMAPEFSEGKRRMPRHDEVSRNNKASVAAGTAMVLAALALVAFLAEILRPAAPIEIAEVITAAGGLLAAVTAAVRAISGR
jgi:hypothetical protein